MILSMRNWGLSACIATMLLILVAPQSRVEAAELTGDFSVGIGVSDNIARTATNTVDETIGSVGMNLEWSESTRKLDGSVRVNLMYLDYLDDTFDEEFIGGMALNFDLTLIEDRLSWIVEDNFGQQLLDPFSVARPGNREDVNFFTTGPTLTLPISARNSIGLDVLYSSVNYEVQPFDNKGGSATARFSREVSAGRNLSLNTTARRIEYDDNVLARDADILETFVRFEGTAGRNTFSVDLGFTNLEVDSDKSDGLLLRADWSRELSPFTTLSVNASSQFSDQGDLFRFNQSGGRDILPTQDVGGPGNVFRYHSADIGYAVDRERTRIRAEFGWSQEDYQSSFSLDRDILRATLFVERDMSRKVFINIVLRYADRKYEYVAIEDSDILGSMSIGYRMGPTFSTSIRYSYATRDSLDPAGEFDENRVSLNVAYTPAWAR